MVRRKPVQTVHLRPPPCLHSVLREVKAMAHPWLSKDSRPPKVPSPPTPLKEHRCRGSLPVALNCSPQEKSILQPNVPSRLGLDTAGRVTVPSHWPTWPKVPGGAHLLCLLAGPASAGPRALAGCLGFCGARSLLGQADGDVHVGSTVLLEVASSLLFIFLPGDPDVLVVQVVQGPVASTIPGVQHRVRGQLNLKHEQSLDGRLPSGSED